MTLFVAEAGPEDAPVVVLLHGAGTSSWMWRKQLEDLSPTLHVLAPDLPGHGRSNIVPWDSIATTAELIGELIGRRAPQGTAHVVGLSLGGDVALHLAACNPSRLTGATASGVNVLPFPHPLAMRLAGTAMGLVRNWPAVSRANARTLRVPPDEIEGFREAASAMTSQAFRRVNSEAVDFRIADGARSSTCSVLAVAGALEHELITRSLPTIAAAFPAGKARIVAGVGHGWNGEKPDLFAAMVRARVLGSLLPPGLETPPLSTSA